MLTTELVKEKAREFGASLCGVGDMTLFQGEEAYKDPRQILPEAKAIIGFGFAVPRGLYHLQETGSQRYSYTSMGVKYIDEEYAEIFLLKMTGLIEDEGYDACPQRTVPNLRPKGDKATNPEVADTYELIYASPVAPNKPAPDIFIDFGKAAQACGLGAPGLTGHILAPKYGPFIRWAFLLTDAPLKADPAFVGSLCDRCGKCIQACPGHAISEKGLDTWQCSVYYKGAHRSNPYQPADFLAGDPEREAILNGEKRFHADSARAIYPKLDFLPNVGGYSPCFCGKACDLVCHRHLKEEGRL